MALEAYKGGADKSRLTVGNSWVGCCQYASLPKKAGDTCRDAKAV